MIKIINLLKLKKKSFLFNWQEVCFHTSDTMEITYDNIFQFFFSQNKFLFLHFKKALCALIFV